MRYPSTKIEFNSKEFVYTEMENGKKFIKKYNLTVKDKQEILAQLKKFNVETINSEKTKGITYDKETTEICFHIKPADYCLSTGATIEKKEKYLKDFGNACKYLFDFVKKNAK